MGKDSEMKINSKTLILLGILVAIILISSVYVLNVSKYNYSSEINRNYYRQFWGGYCEEQSDCIFLFKKNAAYIPISRNEVETVEQLMARGFRDYYKDTGFTYPGTTCFNNECAYSTEGTIELKNGTIIDTGHWPSEEEVRLKLEKLAEET